MGNQISAKQILTALSAADYFVDPPHGQSKFCNVVENHLNVSRERAIELLTQSGLVKFSYVQNEAIHPKDQLDAWQLQLTAAGRQALTQAL